MITKVRIGKVRFFQRHTWCCCRYTRLRRGPVISAYTPPNHALRKRKAKQPPVCGEISARRPPRGQARPPPSRYVTPPRP
ncbi:uncharacterized protein LAJ45_10159 [Morchella importuna]|uniref:uncharacterized protein n=1 Tax=Morchella importuna TaxID=1174673 RepID=UPI001E8D676C|nr:uncharacterized protein LAJ45_10159 [Morchella importuna]KAH8145834.1 hypothetical protein LAJ45_10159 [Morchella importuna]